MSQQDRDWCSGTISAPSDCGKQEHPGCWVEYNALASQNRAPNEDNGSLWSHRFQWLPCNVSFPDGENAQIDSYINNLHPRDHADLYEVIEKIITKAVPFWNIVYQSVGYVGPLATRLRINCSDVSYECPDGLEEDMPDDSDGYEDEYYAYLERYRIYNLPEPGEFGAPVITADDVEKSSRFSTSKTTTTMR